MNRSRWLPLAAASLLSLAEPHGAEARWRYQQRSEVEPSGALVGVVRTTSKSSSGSITVTKDSKHCGKRLPRRELVVGKGGQLAGAVVYLAGIRSGKPLVKGRLTLDQKRCTYLPRVQAAVKGSTLQMLNSDPVLHNVHGVRGGRHEAFNVVMPIMNQRITRKLKRAGLIKVGCDAGHPWMTAYIYVFEHPYFAVTGRDGTFQLASVPPGTYELSVWHEKLGRTSKKIEVKAGAKTRVELRLP